MMVKHTPKVSEKSVKRNIFGPKMDEKENVQNRIRRRHVIYILTRYVYGDQIKEDEMGGRSGKHWGREMCRENYFQNRYIESDIVRTNKKLRTWIIKYRAGKMLQSARHTSLIQSPQQPELNPIEAR